MECARRNASVTPRRSGLMSSRSAKRIALILLVLTALDLCVPGFCQTDGVVLPQARTLSARSLDKAHSGSHDQSTPGDDCFCCCSHVMYSQYFVFEGGRFTAQVVLLESSDAPKQITIEYFRPPRA
jgi:hypothetical protein